MKAVFLVGYMGSGKTTVGKAVAKRINLSFYDLDVYIESKYHKSISSLFSEFGEDAFRKIERSALLEIADFEDCIIATGGGTPCFFNNMDVMNASGTTFYLNASIETLTERLDYKSNKRPLLQGKSQAELNTFISNALASRNVFYEKAQYAIDANDAAKAEESLIKQLFKNV